MENIIEISDYKTITGILNRAFITVAQQFNFSKENAPHFPAFIDFHEIKNQLDKGLKMYGYLYNEQVVGCIGYSYYKDKIYYIERLATLPEYRHLLIGKRLMEHIENRIRDEGGKIAEIHIVDKNGVLKEWYKRLGYIEIRIDEIKTMPFNSLVMKKVLF